VSAAEVSAAKVSAAEVSAAKVSAAEVSAAEGVVGSIEVHVGSGAAGDVREATLLREALTRSGHGPRCSVVVHPQCGHMLVGDLRNRGALDALLRRVLGTTAPPGRISGLDGGAA
jgi:hypothetical protein